MHKAGHAFVGGKAERVEHGAVIGVPFGDPARRIAHGVGGDHQAHRGRAGGELLFPFRDLRVRAGAADHRDHQRRARQPLAFEVDLVGRRVGVPLAKNRGDFFAGGKALLALEHDETPGRELAVVGHARSDGQQGVELGRRGAGPA